MSETDFLKLKKHDNVETNTEKFDIENYLNGNWDKINENAKEVNTNISNINSKNTELEKELKEAQEDFYQNSIRGQASGEYIHVEDSSNCRAKIGINGNSKQETREGYNLANISDKAETTVNSGIKYSRSNGEISLDGSASSSGYSFNFEIATVPAGTYLFTKYAYTGGSGSYSLTLDATNSSGRSQLLNMGNALNKVPKTYTFDEETTLHLKMWSNSGATFSNSILKFQLVEGTEEKEYEQYGASPSPDYPSEVESCGDNGSINEVICNKNIFDKNNPQYLDGYGLNTISFFARGDQRTYIIPVPQNKENITVSYTKNLTGSRYYAFADEIPTDESSSHYGRIMFANSSDTGKITFTAKNNNYKYLLIGSTTSEVFTDLQVEQNPTATSYEEHKEQTYTIPVQQPMRSIGDTRDTFIKKNNKWYERHNIKEVILTGDENWTQRNQGDGTNTVTFNINLLNVGAYGSNNVLCDKFVYEQNSASGNEGIGFESILVTQYIQINRNRLSSPNLEGFKAWLSNNNIKLYYVLKIPEEIECTEEQSQILDELNNARTYKNVTNITTDSIAIIDLDYAKDLETLLTSKESEV